MLIYSTTIGAVTSMLCVPDSEMKWQNIVTRIYTNNHQEYGYTHTLNAMKDGEGKTALESQEKRDDITFY